MNVLHFGYILRCSCEVGLPRSCFTIELDEKFCDVIVKRYIEQVGTAEQVSVVRDGLTYAYAEVANE